MFFFCRFLYGKVPKKEVFKNSLDLFSHMIKQMEISPNNITRLQTLIADIKRNDLLDLLVEYESKFNMLTLCSLYDYFMLTLIYCS